MKNNRSPLQQHESEGGRIENGSVVKTIKTALQENAPLAAGDMSNYVFKKYNGATVCKTPKILRRRFVFLYDSCFVLINTISRYITKRKSTDL